MKKLLSALILSAAVVLGAEVKTLTDMTGNAVKIPANVERIAALWHANNQIILVLGGMDKVVTTTDLIKKNKWFAQIYPRVKDLPAALNGNDIQIEELVKLAPDAVVVSNKNFQENLAIFARFTDRPPGADTSRFEPAAEQIKTRAPFLAPDRSAFSRRPWSRSRRSRSPR